MATGHPCVADVIILRRSWAHWLAIPIMATVTFLAAAVAFVPASRGEVVGTAVALASFLLFAWLLAAMIGSGAKLTRDELRVTVAFRTKRYDLSRLAEVGTTENHANPAMNRYALLWFVGDPRPVSLYLSASRRVDAQRAFEALGHIALANATQGLRREAVSRLATGPSFWMPPVAILLLGMVIASLQLLEGEWGRALFLGAFLCFFLYWFVLQRCNARFGSGQFVWQDWRGRWRMMPLHDIGAVVLREGAPSAIIVQAKDGTEVRLPLLGWAPSKFASAFVADLRKAAGLDAPARFLPASSANLSNPRRMAN